MTKRSSLHLIELDQPEEQRQQTSSPAVSLLSLPSEIIIIILQKADSRKDLKHVRLSSKRLALIAAENLFQEVTVVSHEDSFEQLLKLSEHATLGKHVKCLVYDSRTISTPHDIQLDINRDPIRKLYWETPAKRLYLRSFLKYHDEHTFRMVKDTGKELEYLLRIFESLPSLKAIKIKNWEGYYVDTVGLPRFYERLGKHLGENHCQHFASMGKITHRAWSVLLCAYLCDLKLELLRLEGVKWGELFSFAEVCEVSGYSRILSEAFLSRLIERQPSGQGLHWEPDFYAVFTKAVDRVLNLKSLDLHFGEVNLWTERMGEVSLLWGSGPHPRCLPRLQILRLESFTAIADDLVDFILENSTSLRSLTINNARLLREPDTSCACWVNVIKRLQQGLRLEKACLQGVLSNGGKYFWRASCLSQDEMEASGKRSLKSQVEDFLVHGGGCPLDRAVVSGGSAVRSKQSLWRGDESFCLRNLVGHEDEDDGS